MTKPSDLPTSKTFKFGELTAIISPLSASKSLDLLPEVVATVMPALAALRGVKFTLGKVTADDLAKMAPGISALSLALCNGRLMRYAPELLSTTIIKAPGLDGKMAKWDLSDWSEFDGAFYGRVGKSVLVVKAAVEVSFSDFLAETGFFEEETPTPKNSEDSSPST